MPTVSDLGVSNRLDQELANHVTLGLFSNNAYGRQQLRRGVGLRHDPVASLA